MKWHYPLMKYALGHGPTPEHKLMVPDVHAQVPEWTFAATFLFRFQVPVHLRRWIALAKFNTFSVIAWLNMSRGKNAAGS